MRSPFPSLVVPAIADLRVYRPSPLTPDSTLSPPASSPSSVETTISSHVTTTPNGNGKPATQPALQSVKAEEQRITLSRANSEDSVVKSSTSKATTHADNSKASTSQGGIPGISAPVPALPGFTKKKKQQPKECVKASLHASNSADCEY